MTKFKKSKMTQTDKKKLFVAMKKWQKADEEMSSIAKKYDDKVLTDIKYEVKK